MKILFSLLSILVVFFLGMTTKGFCLSPMVQYNDLVAGGGDPDYRDGSFVSALFNQPAGLAIDPDGTRLFVADARNNRIRVVLLDQNNQVETIAGSGAASLQDGTLDSAAFNMPQFISVIDPNKLLVYDFGDGYFRWADLSSKTVTTPNVKSVDGGTNLHFERVGGMVFQSSENALYFTQRAPRTGVQRLDLKTFVCSPVSLDAPPNADWGPICDYQDHVCVADKNSGMVYELESGANTLTASFHLKEIGQGDDIAVMASMGTTLYAVPARPLGSIKPTGTWMQIAPSQGAGPLSLVEVWGDTVSDTENKPALSYLFAPDYHSLPYGFVADPQDEKKFYLSLPQKNVILSLRDYRFEEYKNVPIVAGNIPNENGITDFDYPVKKPPKTFRILITGDSRTYVLGEHTTYVNRMEQLSKRLELILNTLGSLMDCPVHFQVLHLGHPDIGDGMTWYYYHVPEIVKKFNIDLCIRNVGVLWKEYTIYFNVPLTPEGIPAPISLDREYVSKPLTERVASNPLLKDFLNRCVEAKLGSTTREDEWSYMPDLLKNEGVRNDLEEMYGKPYELLEKKIQSIKTSSGTPVPFCFFFLPQGNIGSEMDCPNESARNFWREISIKKGIHFIDLTDPVNALKVSYYDTAEFMPGYHFNHKGQLLNAMVLAYELIQQKLIPLEFPGTEK